MAEEEKYKVPLFDGSNFHSWRFRMEIMLDEADLMSYIEAPLTLDEVKGTEQEKSAIQAINEKKTKGDKTCKRKIVSKVSDSHLEYLQGKDTAYEMWVSLKNGFERQSLASQHRLKRQLEMLKARPGEDLTTHFLNFEKLVREYKSTGGTLSEKETVLQLFQSIPFKEYQTVISSLETLSLADEKLVTLPVVKGRLMDEEAKLMINSGAHRNKEASSAVFVAKSRPRSPSKHFQYSSTHRQFNNSESSSQGKTNRPNDFKFKCHFCKKSGHKKADCWKRAKWQEKNSGSQANTADSCTSAQGKSSGSNDYCFTTECPRPNSTSTSQCLMNDKSNSLKWCLDSGASEHLINDESVVSNLEYFKEPIKIKVAKSGEHLYAEKYGDVYVASNVNNKINNILIDNVLVAPDLEINLISVRRLEMKGFAIIFENGKATIKHGENVVAVAHRKDKLYELNFKVLSKRSAEANLTELESTLWHRRLGHISTSNLEKLVGMVDGMNSKIQSGQGICEICVSGKQTKLPHKTERTRASRPLQLVHSDIMGPINYKSWNGKRYILCFVDDFTHFTCVYFLEAKSEAFRYFKLYEAMVTAHFNLKLSRFRCDRGGEYLSNEIKEYFEDKGIQHECTISHTPQQNGVSERMNRTIADKARCMLLGSGLRKDLWNEAVLAAVYIINRSPTRALDNKVPAELWYGKKPNVGKLRVFGCVAYLHPAKSQIKSKFDSRTKKCYMVGYCHNGYRLWSPDKQKVIEGRDITFDENKFVCRSDLTDWDGKMDTSVEEEPESPNGTDEVTKEVVETNDTVQEHQLLRRSNRESRPPKYLDDYNFQPISVFALNAETYVEDVPVFYEDIKLRSDKLAWEAAVKEELKALEENETWSLCELPPGRKVIDNKWVFKVKRDAEGEVEKFKARLVIKGCSQKKGFDYNETYAPVARLTTLRILLSVVNNKSLYCQQLDVNNAFLNGDLTEEIFMKQPQGLEDGSNLVCRLNKALYGLKQAPRAWNDKFNKYVVNKIGFKQCENDLCLYVRNVNNDIMYLLLYVDDIILAGSNINSVESVKQKLMTEFKCKDLGNLNQFLGIKITKTKDGMFLSNKTYLENVLNRFEMSNCNAVSTPLDVNPPRDLNGPCIIDLKPYRELVGCLMYAMLSTRPDLSIAVNFFSRYQTNATESQWVGLKRVLRYIKGTINYGLYFSKQCVTTMVGYVDADWANEQDRKSISGYMFEILGGVVSWSSKKQNVIALSSTESEYVALCQASCEFLWLKNLLSEMLIVVQLPVVMFEDNMSCIHMLSKPDHSRQKHIDVKFHFVKDLVSKKLIDVLYISTKEQKADIFTKGLSSVQFSKLRTGLGVLPLG